MISLKQGKFGEVEFPGQIGNASGSMGDEPEFRRRADEDEEVAWQRAAQSKHVKSDETAPQSQASKKGWKILAWILICAGFAILIAANTVTWSASPFEHELTALFLSVVGTAVFVVAFFVNRRSKRGL